MTDAATITKLTDALQWIAARAEYAHDFAGEENRKAIIAEIAKVAIEALRASK